MPRITHLTRLLITISCTLTLLLGGCAAVSVKDDNRPVEIVISKEPTVGSHYLRHAELLERIDEDKDTHRTYEKGLEKVPEYNPDQIQLMHRLALVDANYLFKLDEAEELLKRPLPQKHRKA